VLTRFEPGLSEAIEASFLSPALLLEAPLEAGRNRVRWSMRLRAEAERLGTRQRLYIPICLQT